ncbi:MULTISPECIES: OmpA family protein [Microvirga]|nr:MULTISPECIES: OmpA family protein [unclassified Microvirga]
MKLSRLFLASTALPLMLLPAHVSALQPAPATPLVLAQAGPSADEELPPGARPRRQGPDGERGQRPGQERRQGGQDQGGSGASEERGPRPGREPGPGGPGSDEGPGAQRPRREPGPPAERAAPDAAPARPAQRPPSDEAPAERRQAPAEAPARPQRPAAQEREQPPAERPRPQAPAGQTRPTPPAPAAQPATPPAPPAAAPPAAQQTAPPAPAQQRPAPDAARPAERDRPGRPGSPDNAERPRGQRPGQAQPGAPEAPPAAPPAPTAAPAAPPAPAPAAPAQAAPAPAAPAPAAPAPATRAQPPIPGTPPAAQQVPGRFGPQQAAPGRAEPLDPSRVRIEDLRSQRRERREGDRVIIQEPGNRTIIREGNQVIIRNDETERFRRTYRDADIRTERRGADEEVTIVRRPDGSEIVTVRDADGNLIRRARREPAGRETVLIENRRSGIQRRPGYGYVEEEVVRLPPPVVRIPREQYIVDVEDASQDDLVEAFTAPPVERIERSYTLDEVRRSQPLRERMRRVDVDTVTFEFGSWELAGDQAGALTGIAQAIRSALSRNPNEIFLIEGHTDAVGADEDNLTLSDRRAETVATILTERFQIPAENLTTQGYGEQYLKVDTQGAERQNRRVAMRRITPLLQGQNQQ